MIAVTPQPEPKDFNRLVRKPGLKFLKRKPAPKSKEFPPHWRKILPELHYAYHGICAYACHWIPYDTGSDTVEHFRSKVKTPELAYEWSNYRLVCGTLNGRKKEYTDVADPFHISPGEFILQFPSLFVEPGAELNRARRLLICKTIIRLGLNDEGTCLKSRIRWVLDFCNDDISFAHLKKNAPFIAYELERQNLCSTIKSIMKSGKTNLKPKLC